MKGVIIYSGKYGSTKQYADWISKETGFPVYSIKDKIPQIAEFDTIILGSRIMAYKLSIAPWINQHFEQLKDKKLIIFSVSGAPANDASVKKAYETSISEQCRSIAKFFSFQGKYDLKSMSALDRIFIYIGYFFSRDKSLLSTVDGMDQNAVKPLVDYTKSL